ncbi:MAG: ribonuclease P protein component [Sedimentisphaerales bacterium]|nr:ribonuclease P protein component [Sedimentisphaerales bacterium]
MKRLFYKKSQRICSNEDFKQVLAARISAGQGLFRLFANTNSAGIPRFGVSISKTTGKPILRNRLKRLAREAFRCNQHNLHPSTDYVLIISPKMSKKTESVVMDTIRTMSYNQYESLFMDLVEQVTRRLQSMKKRQNNAKESDSDA